MSVCSKGTTMKTLSKYVHGKSVNLETLYTWSAIQLNEDTLQYTHSAEAFSLMASQEKNHVLLLIFYDGHQNRFERLISLSSDFEDLN